MSLTWQERWFSERSGWSWLALGLVILGCIGYIQSVLSPSTVTQGNTTLNSATTGVTSVSLIGTILVSLFLLWVGGWLHPSLVMCNGQKMHYSSCLDIQHNIALQ